MIWLDDLSWSAAWRNLRRRQRASRPPALCDRSRFRARTRRIYVAGC